MAHQTWPQYHRSNHVAGATATIGQVDPGFSIPPNLLGFSECFEHARMSQTFAGCPWMHQGASSPSDAIFWITAVTEILCQSLTDEFYEMLTRLSSHYFLETKLFLISDKNIKEEIFFCLVMFCFNGLEQRAWATFPYPKPRVQWLSNPASNNLSDQRSWDLS